MSTCEIDRWSTRRQFLHASGGTFATLLGAGLLANLTADEARGANIDQPYPPRRPHFAPRAKQVIFLYMSGGVSHLESFDPKPQLSRDHGKTIVPGEGREFAGRTAYFQKPHWRFRRHGQCGMEVSEIFPHTATCVDDICLIRSMRTDHINHYESALGIHTGSFNVTRPSIGSWVSYGLGTENQNMPSAMVIAPALPYAGAQLWSSDFLPAAHQSTRVIPGPQPIANLEPSLPLELQSLELELLERMNQQHLAGRAGDTTGLSARIGTFQTAFGMQMEAPEIFDLAQESDSTLRMYGVESSSTRGFAWQCLMARRLVERGVRFVELIDSGSSANWDSHRNMQDHVPRARDVDQPIAALLKDLKSRGMLSETLVVWTTEFGRPPYDAAPDGKGRGHQHFAFSTWLAGGGVKPGVIHGATDEYGLSVIEDEVHVHDLHATILYLMGLDHERLTYRYAGRDFRLTDVSGTVVKPILA